MATTAEPITGNEFLDSLLERTPPRASQPKVGQNYNYPLLWYLLPDGRVVQLQGDPHNRAYYSDKGYKLLSDIPARGESKSEVRRYLEDEYPKILAEQVEKAKIVNAIRRANERDRTLNLQEDYDGYTLEELRDELKHIKEQYGKDIRIHTPRQQRMRERMTAEDKLLAGVETTESVSIETIEQRRQRMPRQGG